MLGLGIEIGLGVSSGQGAGGPLVSITGQWAFTSSQSWVVPDGVYKISVVYITPGAAGNPDFLGTTISGAGGTLAYQNDIDVTPGETLTVTISDSVQGGLKRGSTFLVGATPPGSPNATRQGAVTVGTGFPGGEGGGGMDTGQRRGAGAGGYTSVGESAGQTGGDGGGGSSLLGGTLGANADASATTAGATYGGGGSVNSSQAFAGGPGGLRIISGPDRAYPNTNTGDL